MVIALLLPQHQAKALHRQLSGLRMHSARIHLVDGLRANILIGNDLLGPESVSINIAAKTAHIGSCGITVLLDARQQGPFIRRKVLAQQQVTLPPRSEKMVAFTSPKLPDDRDFVF